MPYVSRTRRAALLSFLAVAASFLFVVFVSSSGDISRGLHARTFVQPQEEGFVHTAVERRRAERESRLNDELHGAAEEEVQVPAPDIDALRRHRAFSAAGVYLTASSVNRTAFFRETMDRLQAAGGTAIVFDVKGSRVYFDTTSPMAREMNLVQPLLDLPAVIAEAKERGIYTIARFIALKDPGLAPRKPETQIRHPATQRSVGAMWVDGSHPVTLAYNEEVLRDLVAAGIDEINLDYIRYPTEYAPAQIGLTGREKADRIGAFLRMARETIDEQGGETLLGISTYAILGWNFPINFEPLGQDIPHVTEIVDIISPMAYPATFAAGAYYVPGRDPRSRMYFLVKRTLDGYKELVGEENVHKLRPWIQGYFASQKDLRDQIDAVYDAGLCGFTVWSAGNIYGAFYPAFTPVEPPERCRSASF